MEKTETAADFGAVLKGLIGRLVFLTLRDGTRLKGDVKAIKNGTVELHSLLNIHYISTGEIEHATVAKEMGRKAKIVKNSTDSPPAGSE